MRRCSLYRLSRLQLVEPSDSIDGGDPIPPEQTERHRPPDAAGCPVTNATCCSAAMAFPFVWFGNLRQLSHPGRAYAIRIPLAVSLTRAPNLA
jgi:hypothetical protein